MVFFFCSLQAEKTSFFNLQGQLILDSERLTLGRKAIDVCMVQRWVERLPQTVRPGVHQTSVLACQRASVQEAILMVDRIHSCEQVTVPVAQGTGLSCQ